MLKIRLMGTREDILWFQEVLQNMPGINVINPSDIFTNSGTSRYYRFYTGVEKKGLDSDIENTGKRGQL